MGAALAEKPPTTGAEAMKCQGCRSSRFVVLKLDGTILLKCVNCQRLRAL